MFDIQKLAVYVDEVDDDPLIGCGTCASLRRNNVILRFAWTNNVCNISDQACAQLSNAIHQHKLNVVAIASEIGKVPVNQLRHQKPQRAFDIATYFKSNYIRFYIGLKTLNVNLALIDEWMAQITEMSIIHNIMPLLEITDDCAIYNPADIAILMKKHQRWRLWYDPVQFILHQNVDQYVKYWTLLRQYVGLFEIRDHKIGQGSRPAGLGDAKLQLMLKDANNINLFSLEGALGRHYGSATTKLDTFNLAYSALQNLII